MCDKFYESRCTLSMFSKTMFLGLQTNKNILQKENRIVA